MNLLSWPWERDEKPFFSNDEGFDWWIVEILTQACEREGVGSPLPNTKVFFVSKDNKPVTYAIVRGNELIYENTNFESVCYKIDVLRMIEEVVNEDA
jgi:hypothetical protein